VRRDGDKLTVHYAEHEPWPLPPRPSLRKDIDERCCGWHIRAVTGKLDRLTVRLGGRVRLLDVYHSRRFCLERQPDAGFALPAALMALVVYDWERNGAVSLARAFLYGPLVAAASLGGVETLVHHREIQGLLRKARAQQEHDLPIDEFKTLERSLHDLPSPEETAAWMQQRVQAIMPWLKTLTDAFEELKNQLKPSAEADEQGTLQWEVEGEQRQRVEKVFQTFFEGLETRVLMCMGFAKTPQTPAHSIHALLFASHVDHCGPQVEDFNKTMANANKFYASVRQWKLAVGGQEIRDRMNKKEQATVDAWLSNLSRLLCPQKPPAQTKFEPIEEQD
jgi:hypothetical protein